MAEHRADLLAISATITLHVPQVEGLIRSVRRSRFGGKPAIMVGGNPFNLSSELWRAVGADATAPDARSAIDVAESLVA